VKRVETPGIRIYSPGLRFRENGKHLFAFRRILKFRGFVEGFEVFVVFLRVMAKDQDDIYFGETEM
jgi:hypothetical protein